MVALVGLFLKSDGGGLSALGPRGAWPIGLGAGLIGGLAVFLAMWALLAIPQVRELDVWQGVMVRNWSSVDIVAVAVFSGCAEEALIRALLQPWIGLVPAAVLFAALHIVPDRRLWTWPVLALAMGLVFGLLFERWGYPAPALAHTVVNLVSLWRLSGREVPVPDEET